MKALRGILLYMLALLAPLSLNAAPPVAADASYPEKVGVGEKFNVDFILNTSPERFGRPDFGGAEIIEGPLMSSSKVYTMSDGEGVIEERYVFSYSLRCGSEGEYIIKDASFVIDGDVYIIESIRIKAVPAESSSDR